MELSVFRAVDGDGAGQVPGQVRANDRRSRQTAARAVDLEQLVARKVADELASTNGRIDELVREALEAEVGRRVREFIDAELDNRANGVELARDSARRASASSSPGSKVCTRCGEEKPIDRFPRHRNMCRQMQEPRHRRVSSTQAVGADRPFRGWRWVAVDALAVGRRRALSTPPSSD
jgi:hypothetical protein